MIGAKDIAWNAFQVIQGIIRWIAIFVVNVMPFRYSPVSILPDFNVKRLDARHDMDGVRPVVTGIRPVRGLRIASKLNPFVNNRFDSFCCRLWHDRGYLSAYCSLYRLISSIISPYRAACKSIYPLPCT